MPPDPQPTCSKTLLVLTPQFPYPPHQGTTIRNYNLITHLARRHTVHLLSFGDPETNLDTPLHAVCRSVQVIQTPARSMRQRLKGLIFSRLPDMARRLPSMEFRAALDRLLEQTDLDVVQVEGIELAQYLFRAAEWRGGAARPLLVFDDHNAEYVLQQRAFETDSRLLLSPGSGLLRRWIGAAYSFVQWRRLRRYERRACRTADRVVAVSEADAGALRRLVPGLAPLVVPNGVDMGFYSRVPTPDPRLPTPTSPSLVFTGKMDFRPNVDAVLWFAREVLPLIRAEVPEVRLWIVGKDPHPRLATLREEPSVVVTGRVDDVRPYIAAAGVYVIPLRIGGGTRLKVLEAMAMGKAIVSTTLGCEGFDLAGHEEVVLADAPTEFAAAVVALLGDSERRGRLGAAAHRHADANYDWSNIVPKLEQTYDNGPAALGRSIAEDNHWWFAGRTWSLLNMIDRLARPDGSRRVLDVGCGAGNMMHHLARYGRVVGVDSNPKPLAVAQERGYDVREGSAERLPLDDGSFDLVALLDTVEHCDDDLAVLCECHRVCAPGGLVVITVPAFMWLWSHNDTLNAHKRRYSAQELRQKLAGAGFRVRRMTYNNFFLFPMAAGLILARRGARREPELGSPHFDDESYQVEMEPAPPLLNTVLRCVTWTEAQVLRRVSLPLGTALICIAEKP